MPNSSSEVLHSEDAIVKWTDPEYENSTSIEVKIHPNGWLELVESGMYYPPQEVKEVIMPTRKKYEAGDSDE